MQFKVYYFKLILGYAELVQYPVGENFSASEWGKGANQKHHEEFRYLLIYSLNSGLESQPWLGAYTCKPLVMSKLAGWLFITSCYWQVDMRPAVGWQALALNRMLLPKLFKYRSGQAGIMLSVIKWTLRFIFPYFSQSNSPVYKNANVFE